jgi:tight adherence protein C
VSALAALLGLGLGLGLWSLLGAMWPLRPGRRWDERLAPYLLDISQPARDLYSPPHHDPLVVAGVLLGPSLQRIVIATDRVLGGRDAQAPLFGASGLSGSFESFRARRTVGGMAGVVAGMVLGLLLSLIGASPPLQSIIGGGLLGAVVMLWWADRRVSLAAKDRHERITEEFPTIIELLGLALAAGDSLPRALTRVSRRAKGELGAEWARVMALVEVGAPLAPTLRDSAHRVGAPHVTAFVEHLAQALDRGAPLAEVVASHARDAKEEYTRGLVDRAGKAEVQMLVPMVLLILPVTVIFAVYPGLQALQFGF